MRSVQLMVDRGELEAWKTPGGHRRISRASINAWIERRQNRPAEAPRDAATAPAARAQPRVLLIEEPQAAFYAWLACHSQDWERQVAPGETILVCDIGGGTSDFSILRLSPTRARALDRRCRCSPRFLNAACYTWW